MNIQPVVIAVIKNKDRYLLTRRCYLDEDEKKFGPHVWNLPGGGIQFGETPEDAIKREIMEELGVDIEIKQLIPKLFTETRQKWQGIFLCYLSVLKNEEAEIVLNYEADQYDWFTSRDVTKLKILPHADQICREADKIKIK